MAKKFKNIGQSTLLLAPREPHTANFHFHPGDVIEAASEMDERVLSAREDVQEIKPRAEEPEAPKAGKKKG